MARRASGSEVLERVRADIAAARSLAQLRTAQCVLLPLEFGLTLEETAQAVGRSPAWVARERRRYISGNVDFVVPLGHGGRRNQLMTAQEEMELVKKGVMLSAHSFTIRARPKIRELIEAHTRRQIEDSTLDSIIARVAGKLIAGGTAADLWRMGSELTRIWARERSRVEQTAKIVV